MSHLATVQTEIKDIKAVKALCDELGLTLHEGKTSHQLFTEVAPCQHAISHPSWLTYEIGLIQTETGYTLSYDNMLEDAPARWAKDDGFRKQHNITGEGVPIGAGACRILQLYGVHKATIEAKKLGYMVSRKTGTNGAIKLTVSGM